MAFSGKLGSAMEGVVNFTGEAAGDSSGLAGVGGVGGVEMTGFAAQLSVLNNEPSCFPSLPSDLTREEAMYLTNGFSPRSH